MEAGKPKAKWYVYFLIFIAAILGAIILSNLAILQTLELKSIDWRFDLRGPQPVEDLPIVILAIDDQSDESTPARWPWPRSYFAHVIENLEQAGAAAIAIDVIFDQPDRSGPEQDDIFAATLAKYDNVVLTGKLLRTFSRYSFETLIPPYEKFIESHTAWGLAALESDLDGFYRRYPVIQEYNDSLYLSLAAQLLRIYEARGDNSYRYAMSDQAYRLGNHIIPKFDWLGMLINYYGPAGTFKYYSFDNVLDDSEFDLREDFDMDVFDDPGDSALGIPPGLKYSGALKDKIVLIGSTIQELHDNFPTPFLEYRNANGELVKAEMPGVEIHANALATILTDSYLKPVPILWVYALVVLLGLIIFLFARYTPTVVSALLVLILLALYTVLTIFSFVNYRIVFPLISPVAVMVLGYVGFTIYNFVLTQKEKRMLRGAFAHYVPESVIREIMNDPQKLSLGGEERVLTILFSDVAGFTTISEQLTPHELVALLNEYLTEMTEIVLEHKGTIDKFEGDAIMAEFGAPIAFPDHAQMACRAALAMQAKLKKLRMKWKEEGKPQLHVRIGINTGEVIIGNMGSRNTFDYTAMGDHVNLGARLEGANKFYGTHIMISEFTHRVVKDDFITRPLDLIRVKGKTKPIEVFELIATKDTKFTDQFNEFLELYRKGIVAYRKRNWLQAIDIFDYCLKLVPDDKPSKLYRERCVDFRLNPPPPDWDGVITMKEK